MAEIKDKLPSLRGGGGQKLRPPGQQIQRAAKIWIRTSVEEETKQTNKQTYNKAVVVDSTAGLICLNGRQKVAVGCVMDAVKQGGL